MDLSGQRVCVTGASGFLGSHLVEELLSQGADVTAFDRVPNPAMARANRGNSGFGFVLGDIQTLQKSLDWFERCNVIIHLAGVAIPRVCNNDPDLAFQVNVEGTKEIL